MRLRSHSVAVVVLVGFEHGDPAQPYVIGTLYNGDHTPPVPLP